MIAFGAVSNPFFSTASAPAAQTSAPAATITSIDAKTGLITARINATGQLFQFALANKALLNRVHPGQGVYVNVGAKQISLDGKTASGTIVNIETPPKRQPPSRPSALPPT